MYDLVIRSATVVDGSGTVGQTADVAIADGRIVEVGRIEASRAGRQLDAEGLVLAPGFIDLHAHSDLLLLDDPEHGLKVRMGVTTELLGQDGLSYAPATPDAIVEMRDLVAGINGAPDIAYDWTGVAEYLGRLEAAKTAVNVAYLVPHGLLRLTVMGMADRVATDDEIARMSAMAADGMRDGALGLSAASERMRLVEKPNTSIESPKIVTEVKPEAMPARYTSPRTPAKSMRRPSHRILLNVDIDLATSIDSVRQTFPV